MKPSWSLRARLLSVSLTVLLCFVVLTGAALDRAFRDSADAAQRERLEALLLLLMGALEVAQDGRLLMPPDLPEARLAIPASGLYAQIVRVEAQADPQAGVPMDPAPNSLPSRSPPSLSPPSPSPPSPPSASPSPGAGSDAPARSPSRWQSDSTLGLAVPFAGELAPGERASDVRRGDDGQPYRIVGQGVRWAIGRTPSNITFSVAAPLASTGAEVEVYRRSLWSALAVMAGLLLIALVLVQHWGLRPLRVLARRLAAMEAGKTRELAGPYPRELAPLANNLDRLLQRERALMDRHRTALGDLAHALKTPLAILQGATVDAELPALVHEQTRRMDEIVQYQLQRAATAGASQSAPPLALAPLVERLLASMNKVHADRRLQLASAVSADVQARIDEGDAMELLGNLIDNACKWAKSSVRVQAARREGGLLVSVEDDGPGIAEPQRLMQRGQRGDECVPGHGIGLAIVQDIALAYRGELRIERSDLGGARLAVWLGEC